MARTYRALSAMLAYPTEALQAATAEIAAALAEEDLVKAPQRAAIDALLAELAGGDIYELQERYFSLFDRSRTLSLHLFEHVHGESRDRGQAMVDLIELYRGHGFEPTASELPDFLPLFLEFLSLLSGREAQALLAEPAGILQALAERLVTRKSNYAAVFQALATLAGAPATARRIPAPKTRRSRGAGRRVGGGGGAFRAGRTDGHLRNRSAANPASRRYPRRRACLRR